MKKKPEKRLFDLYNEWMQTGEIKDFEIDAGNGGLCNALPPEYTETLKMFLPELPLEPEDQQLALKQVYWAGNYENNIQDTMYKFTPLRQTIVLFICALHKEL